MSHDDDNFKKSDLESPAYRQRLMRKINCLIAVLEVACSKVRRSLDAPDADTERLERIQSNLTQTLDVCRRAKGALERREQLPGDLPSQLAEISNIETLGDKPLDQKVVRPHKGKHVEFADNDEAERFESMAPIAKDEVASVDLDELSRLLQEG
ncbi:MAG: hypothetical protein AAFZ65_01880 [Planctomycetota bacterium]